MCRQTRFGDAGVLFAVSACAFSRDLAAGAPVDKSPNILTGVCAVSRDETTGAEVCVSDLPVNHEQSTWAFSEFPKVDSTGVTLTKRV